MPESNKQKKAQKKLKQQEILNKFKQLVIAKYNEK